MHDNFGYYDKVKFRKDMKMVAIGLLIISLLFAAAEMYINN